MRERSAGLKSRSRRLRALSRVRSPACGSTIRAQIAPSVAGMSVLVFMAGFYHGFAFGGSVFLGLRRPLLDDLDLVRRQAVEFVDERVDLPIRPSDLRFQHRLVVRRFRGGEAFQERPYSSAPASA